MALADRTFVTHRFAVAPPGAVPRQLPGADRMPTAGVDAVVLAKVDGVASVAAIAALVGISAVECASVIARLVELGSVTFSENRSVGSDARATIPSGLAPPPIRHRWEGEPRSRSGRRRRMT